MQYCGSFNNNGYRITLEIATKMNINETKPDTVVWRSILPFKIFNNAIFKIFNNAPSESIFGINNYSTAGSFVSSFKCISVRVYDGFVIIPEKMLSLYHKNTD